MSADNFQISVELPSRGRIYPPSLNVPEEVVLRAMTTAEVKKLYGSVNNADIVNQLVAACIVDRTFDLYELITPDIHCLLMKLRSHSFGSSYWVQGVCSNCNDRRDYEIDLEEFPVNFLPDDFQEPYTLTLPQSGHVLQLRLLREKDTRHIRRLARQMAKTRGEDFGELEFVYRYAKMIVSIDDQPASDALSQQFIMKLNARDLFYIRSYEDSLNIGMDTTVYQECPVCGESLEFVMPINSEFFRPRFKLPEPTGVRSSGKLELQETTRDSLPTV